MSGRIRTTKQLARRIQKDYFKQTFPIPRWRRALSWAFLTVAGGYVGWHAVARDSSIYSSGSLARHHASFGSNCGACHNQAAGVFAGTVTDARCPCHDGPVHSVRQVTTPACAGCHVEHRGREVLHPGERCNLHQLPFQALHTKRKRADGGRGHPFVWRWTPGVHITQEGSGTNQVQPQSAPQEVPAQLNRDSSASMRRLSQAGWNRHGRGQREASMVRDHLVRTWLRSAYEGQCSSPVTLCNSISA